MAPSGTAKMLIFALAMALAELMYQRVETPYRQRRSSLLRVAGPAAATIVSLAAIAFVANRQDGWPWRLSAQARELADLQRFGFWPCAKSAQSKCAFGSLSEPVGLQLLGDSFAEHYVAALDLVVHHGDFDVLIPSHSRIGKLSGGTRTSMLLGTPG